MRIQVAQLVATECLSRAVAGLVVWETRYTSKSPSWPPPSSTMGQGATEWFVLLQVARPGSSHVGWDSGIGGGQREGLVVVFVVGPVLYPRAPRPSWTKGASIRLQTGAVKRAQHGQRA